MLADLVTQAVAAKAERRCAGATGSACRPLGARQAVVWVHRQWRRFSLLIGGGKATRLVVGIGGQNSFGEAAGRGKLLRVAQLAILIYEMVNLIR